MTARRIAIDPEGLARGVQEFNLWRFYDCHETLEDIWREEESDLADFYQGLIKAAAGFHHLLRGNHKGTVVVLGGAVELLSPFTPRCLGVNVERLIEDMEACLEVVRALGPERLSEFDRALIPHIEFDPEEES